MQQFSHAHLMEQFSQRLTESQLKLDLLKQQYHLSADDKARIHAIVEKHALPPSLKRLLIYLIDNPGSRSDAVARDCAIGNVSDAWTPPRRQQILKRMGLNIRCEVLPSCNRFGAPTTIGHLFLMVDAE